MPAFSFLVVFTLAAHFAHAQQPNPPRVTGPVLLHANIDQQWGGHTFAYLLEGERSLFWSATAYNKDGNTWASLIGQHPKPNSTALPVVSTIPMPGERIKSMTQPLILRTPDGIIHVIVGLSRDSGEPNYHPGEIRYYRSAKSEDASTFIDRTECISREAPYNAYHLRMNAGISKDGQHAAIVALAISNDGSVPFNTPVIFFAERVGEDFVFRAPVRYSDAMGFFYPQIALTDDGVVLAGQVWDNADRSITRLVHLDWNGQTLHREDLPAAEDGNYWCCDLRPIANDDWSTLGLYYNAYPKSKQNCRHEFWTYVPATRALTMRNSLAVPEGRINYGKWFPIGKNQSAFLHNPSMGTYEFHEGDILGGGELRTTPLPLTNPATLGYAGSAYTFVPNPLQGSVATPNTIYFASDYITHKNNEQDRMRGAFLLYQLDWMP